MFAPAFTRIDRVEPADIPPKNVIDTSRSWWFATVKVRVAVARLPSASVADHVTVDVPIGKTPLAGHVVAVVVSGYVIANVVATLPLQLSLAVTPGFVTVPPMRLPASVAMVVVDGTPANTGSVPSSVTADSADTDGDTGWPITVAMRDTYVPIAAE